MFEVAIHFYPGYQQAKTPVNSLSALITIAIVNNKWSIICRLEVNAKSNRLWKDMKKKRRRMKKANPFHVECSYNVV